MMITLAGGISLKISEPDKENQGYSSCRIQKGLLLFQGNKDLSWAGIAYSISPHIQEFAYDIKIGIKK